MKLLFVSNNQHKIAEVEAILGYLYPDCQLLTLKDFPQLNEEIAETGASYQENALIKAQACRHLTNLPIIADDSGVEVEAFPQLLGIHSARWLTGSSFDRAMGLLKKLEGEKNRTLIYHCWICLLLKDKEPQYFHGQLPGQAALDYQKGISGFGYDPIFIPDGQTKRLSQLPQTVKNKISHRRQALEKTIAYLKKTLNF